MSRNPKSLRHLEGGTVALTSDLEITGADVSVEGVSISELRADVDELGQAGGDSIIQKTTITLTDAQIKALPTTPIALVPAPGAGKRNELILALFESAIAAAYTNIGAQSYGMFISYGLTDFGIASINISNGTGAGQAGSNALTSLLTLSARIQVIPVHCWSGVHGTTVATEDFAAGTDENAPLVLKCDNTGGNFTGGNAANTLKVTVLYAVLDVG
jgi:hypothetical protein